MTAPKLLELPHPTVDARHVNNLVRAVSVLAIHHCCIVKLIHTEIRGKVWELFYTHVRINGISSFVFNGKTWSIGNLPEGEDYGSYFYAFEEIEDILDLLNGKEPPKDRYSDGC